MIAALNDVDAGVRESAAWALGELGDDRALAPLERVEQDTVPAVRQRAAEALERLRQRLKGTPLRN